MQVHFLSAGLILVSALTTISCSRSTTDSWSPGAPRIEWDKQDSMSLLEPTKRAVPVNAKIKFPGDPIAQINVTTECRSEFRDDIENRAFSIRAQNRNELEIANLLPDHIWRQYDFSKLGKTICSFKFKTQNQVGSRWSFTVPGFEITDLSKLENFRYRPYDRDTLKGENVGYNLACEYFQNSRGFTEPRLIGDAVRETANGEISNRFGAVDAVDSRLRYPIQKCRVSVDRQGADGVPDRYVSQIFDFNFKLPKVETSAKLEFQDSILTAHTNKSRVLEVQLANRSTVPVAYRLFDVKPENLFIQLVLVRPSNIFRIEDQYRVTLNYNFENVSRVMSEGENRIVEVAPGEVARISATVTTSRLCLEEPAGATPENLQSSLTRGVAGHVGYTYRFASGRFMERLVNWNPEKPDLKSPVLNTEVFNTESYNENSKEYPGWAPLRGWVALGKGARPKIDAVFDGKTLPCRLTTVHSPGTVGAMNNVIPER